MSKALMRDFNGLYVDLVLILREGMMVMFFYTGSHTDNIFCHNELTFNTFRTTS